MTPLKVGDRVAAYDHGNREICFIRAFLANNLVAIAGPDKPEWIVHRKQLRKLRPKWKAREYFCTWTKLTRPQGNQSQCIALVPHEPYSDLCDLEGKTCTVREVLKK